MMAASSVKSPISLLNFYIYNSSYGAKEGEEQKKILYYYPTDVDLDTQMKNVGLSEALTRFTATFNPGHPCDSLHTQKMRQLFYQPEEKFWMVMTVSIPFIPRIKDKQEYLEYQGDDVHDNVFQAILKQAYQMFCLFRGTFSFILERDPDVAQLKQTLEYFFTRYLPTMKLNHADILDIFQGIQFLPLDKQTFLRVQCFVNLVQTMWIKVKYIIFMYNDQLVWSGLDQENTQVIYRYLVTSLLPSFLEAELQGAASNAAVSHSPTSPFATPHYGKFVTGPANLQDAGSAGKVPKLFIHHKGLPLEELHLITYRALSATICLLFDTQPSFEVYKKLDNFLGPQLSAVASDIAEQCNKKMGNLSSEVSCRFIYFNCMNLAQKSTVHLDNRRTGNITIASDVLKLLSDINADLCRDENTAEIVMKTVGDCWVVGKQSDGREFYVVINQKNANLIDISEEVRKMCAAHLNNIFFHD